MVSPDKEMPIADNSQSKQSEIQEWYTTAEVSQRCGCGSEKIRRLVRVLKEQEKLLKTTKVSGTWTIHKDEIAIIQDEIDVIEALDNEFNVQDSGLLQVTSAIALAPGTIFTLFPQNIPPAFITLLYMGVFIISVSGLYNSLWLLGEYVEDVEKVSLKRGFDNKEGWIFGLGHVLNLLFSPFRAGPYWLLGMTLLFSVAAILIFGLISLIPQ